MHATLGAWKPLTRSPERYKMKKLPFRMKKLPAIKLERQQVPWTLSLPPSVVVKHPVPKLLFHGDPTTRTNFLRPMRYPSPRLMDSHDVSVSSVSQLLSAVVHALRPTKPSRNLTAESGAPDLSTADLLECRCRDSFQEKLRRSFHFGDYVLLQLADSPPWELPASAP